MTNELTNTIFRVSKNKFQAKGVIDAKEKQDKKHKKEQCTLKFLGARVEYNLLARSQGGSTVSSFLELGMQD